jgi:hypothetical protein
LQRQNKNNNNLKTNEIMTLETLNKLETEYDNKMAECMAEYNKTQDAKKAARKQYADEYVKEHPEFEKFLGKKVLITSKHHKFSNVGYFEGFELAYNWEALVTPILYKVKKDGSRSKIKYAFYEVPFVTDMTIDFVK